jgi:transposase-like protein
MTQQRKHYSPDLKAKVALEAIKGGRTITEIASHFGVHPNVVLKWKQHALKNLAALFSDGSARGEQAAHEELQARLYQQIGQLKVELDWLKKKSGALA